MPPLPSFDPYAVLGVPHDASIDSIRSAWRKIAMRLHPDRNPGDPASEELFKRASRAYDTLSDPIRRAACDQDRIRAFRSAYRSTAPSSRPSPSARRAPGPFVRLDRSSLASLFSSFRSSATPSFKASITLAQAAAGTSVGLRFPSPVPCRSCRGSACPACGGSGSVSSTTLRTPPGVRDGDRLQASAASPADVLLTVSVLPHPIFRLEGIDLFAPLPIPFHLAALGGSVQAPSLFGEPANVRIPAGSQPGDVLRIKGFGFPRQGDLASRGDLFLTLAISVPTRLSPRQEALLSELASSFSDASS